MHLRTAALAGLFALSLCLSPAPTHARVAPTGQTAGSGCGVVPADDYWLCEAVVGGDCGLVESDQYWWCRAITTRACGLLPAGDDYWLCVGLTTSGCGVVAGPRYWLCKSVVDRNCGLAANEDYWRCAILRYALREQPEAEL